MNPVPDEVSVAKTSDWWRYEVLLDGEKVKGAVSASVSKGVVEALNFVDGYVSVRDRKTVTLRGLVEIRRRE